MRVVLCLLVGSLQAPAALAQDPPYGNLLWNGNDPFHQPVATTNYYGSGDIDGDGGVTSADVALAEDMAAGAAPMRITADVDGDRDVDAADVALLEQTLAGGTLPAWWNRLTTREQRESWALKVMQLDATNEHTPWSYWFQCGGFSTQTFIHAAYYRGDLQGTYFEGGPTVFNLPMYPVGVSSSNFGHAINGILVGDDPRSFDDWLFLEPQTDEIVLPGMWDMPYGNTVSIYIPYRISRGGAWAETKIRFDVHEGGGSLLEYSADLLLARGNPGPPGLDDPWDQWNPVLVPTPTGLLLFQQSRDDVTRTSDIHLQELRNCGAQPAPMVLTSAPQYSRLLDAHRDAAGEIHLLWEGKTDYVPGVFYGRLSNDMSEILEVARVSDGNRRIRMGRVAVTAAGERHVFWLEDKSGGSHPYETGIYWSKRSGGNWSPEENLAALGFPLFDFSDWWQRRDALRYYFDVEPIGDHLVLAWNEPAAQSSANFTLRLRNYDGTGWGNPTTLGNAGSAGVALATDGMRMYLVDSAPGTTLSENRGSLRARTSNNGIDWSAPVVVDAGGQACCPRMASSGSEAVLIWDRRTGMRSVPLWSRNSGFGWSAGQQLDPGAGNDAWFPTVTRLPGGEVIAAWSSRSTTSNSVAVARLAGQSPCPAPPTVSAVSPNNGPTAGGTVVTITGTHFEPGASVTFGGTPAGTVGFVNDTTLTAVTPAHATGAVAVAITTDHGTGSKANAFFYTPPRGASDFYSLPPCRILDTRNSGGPALSPGQQRLFTVAGICGIPADADAISVNVTVVSPAAPGYFAFYPGNAFPFGTSTINFSAGQTRANNAILSLATDGGGNLGVQNASAGSSHLIVDVNGYFLE